MLLMKSKKVISALLLSVALFGGGLAHTQSVDAALSKKQAISIIKKEEQTPTSSQTDQISTTKYRKQKTTIKTKSIFNSQAGVLHSISTAKSGKKTQQLDEWVDLNSKRIYSIQDGKWQYDKLPDYLVKELNNLKNGKSLQKFNKSIYQEMSKKAKITSKNGTYTVKGTLKGQKMLDAMLKLMGSNKVDTSYLHKNFKFSKCTFVYTIKDKKIIDSKYALKATLAKSTQVTVKMRKSHFGQFDTLTLPDEVKNATAASLK